VPFKCRATVILGLLRRFAAALIFAVLAVHVAGSQAAVLTSCDYSFIVRQPLFTLVAPEESSVDAPLQTTLGVTVDGGDFSTIRQVRLVPDVGKPMELPASFKVVRAPPNPVSRQQGPPVASMDLPELVPSTTYDVVLMVRTVGAGNPCPKVLSERIARFTTESATSLDAIALRHAKAEAPTPGKLSGPDIFENALKELRTLDYPPYISFLVTTRGTVDGKRFEESFRSSVRTSDDYVTTHAVPVATTNKPINPYGWNINIPLLSQLFPPRRTDNVDEPFGVPEISPLFTFGLRPTAPAHFGRPNVTASPDASIKTIGHIRTVGRDYDATLLDTEPFFDRYVYHLKLQPIGDPRVYRLREAWVDTQAFIIWRLRVDGIFDSVSASKIPWDIYYTVVGGHWVIGSERAVTSVKTGGFLAGTAEREWQGLGYKFSDFTFPDDDLDLEFATQLKTDAIQY